LLLAAQGKFNPEQGFFFWGREKGGARWAPNAPF